MLSSTHFNLVRLKKGEESQATIEGFETLYAVLSDNVDREVNGASFRNAGRREEIWAGNEDSVYDGSGAAQGIGFAIARGLGQAGARIVVNFPPRCTASRCN